MLFAVVTALFLAAVPDRAPAQGPWQASGPAYPLVEAIMLVPGEENVLYAAARDPVSETSGLFRSEDGGLTWDLLAQAPFQASVRQLAIDPTEPERMLAFTQTPTGHDFVYRTDDGGISWRQIFADPNVQAVFFDSVAADTAYLLVGEYPRKRLSRSDAGGGWEPVLEDTFGAWVSPKGTLFVTVEVGYPPYPPYYLFPHLVDDLFASATQGRFFINLGQAACPEIDFVAYAPGDSNIAYATGPCGLFLASGDGGASWAPPVRSDLAQILPPLFNLGAHVARIAVDPLDSARIFLTAVANDGTGGALLRSDDGGESWRQVPAPETPTGPLAIGSDSRVLFVGTSQGVFRLPLGRTQTLPPRPANR
jgi:photosystem II stability/assembly factor-like uncharacterized protein